MRKESIIVWGVALIVVGIVVFGIFKMSGTDPSKLSLTEAVSASDHVEGNAQAKVVLVEYGDYQCPACGAYHPLLQQLLKDEAGKYAFVFRNFPLPQHQNALSSAYAAEAASLQGKFWEMHDMIYEHQKDWSEASNGPEIFAQYAQALKLDMAKYQKDIASDEVAKRVSHDLTTGQAAGINSTPTFFLNGQSITVTSYDQLKQLIESAAHGA